MNKPKLTLGSLFDGIGGFCLAGQMAGIQPVWASEIEPFPIRVTEKRFPDVLQLGDIHALHGEDIPPVDVITFGREHGTIPRAMLSFFVRFLR